MNEKSKIAEDTGMKGRLAFELEKAQEELEQTKDALAQQTRLLEQLRKENSEMEEVIIHLKAELYDYMTM